MTKETPKKTNVAKAKKSSMQAPKKKGEPRVVAKPAYSSFKLQKRIKQTGPELPGAYTIFRRAIAVFKQNWKVFLGITVLYGVINMIVVQSMTTSSGVDQTRNSFEGMFSGGFGHVFAGAASFVYLLGASGNTSGSTAGSYQLIWILIISLAIIWALRETMNGVTIRIRDAFYRGMYPLVPFVFVLVVITIQLAPMIIIGSLFSSAASTGSASSSVDMIVWSVMLLLASVGSLYMVSSSIFALYIVSLPDMTPFAALRSAKGIVANRRWAVMRKLLFLPFILLLIGALIMVPLIIGLPALASWILFVLLMVCVPVMHSYVYTLYRTLL